MSWVIGVEPSHHKALKPTRRQEGRSGTQSRRKKPPLTGLGQDQRNTVVSGTRGRPLAGSGEDPRPRSCSRQGRGSCQLLSGKPVSPEGAARGHGTGRTSPRDGEGLSPATRTNSVGTCHTAMGGCARAHSPLPSVWASGLSTLWPQMLPSFTEVQSEAPLPPQNQLPCSPGSPLPPGWEWQHPQDGPATLGNEKQHGRPCVRGSNGAGWVRSPQQWGIRVADRSPSPATHTGPAPAPRTHQGHA